VDERILSLVKSLSSVGELEPEKAPRSFDFPALRRINNNRPDRAVYLRLFDVEDRVAECQEAYNKLQELAEKLKFEVVKVARTYAYKIVAPFEPPFSKVPHIAILYASSHDDFERFENLTNEYEHFIQSLNHMMWDSIQYVQYLSDYEWYEKPRKIILDFYKKYQKYLDITIAVHNDIHYITIFCPVVIKGLLIGKNGSTVKSLKEKLKEQLGNEVRIEIRANKYLTEKYREDHPDINLPPEAMKILSEIIPQLKTLREKYGVQLHEIDIIINSLIEQKEGYHC